MCPARAAGRQATAWSVATAPLAKRWAPTPACEKVENFSEFFEVSKWSERVENGFVGVAPGTLSARDAPRKGVAPDLAERVLLGPVFQQHLDEGEILVENRSQSALSLSL